MIKPIALSLALLAVLGLSACNTVEGAGKDIQAAGKALERGAEKAKPN